jgi:hypothetical protein
MLIFTHSVLLLVLLLFLCCSYQRGGCEGPAY